jgi:hypothetical protein
MPKNIAISNKYQQLVESHFAYDEYLGLKSLSRCLHEPTFKSPFQDGLPQHAAAG